MDPSAPFEFKILATHPTDWDPSTSALEVSLNVRLDGCIVPSDAASGARVAFSHVVALDGLLDESLRQELFKFLVGDADADGGVRALPEDRWERRTADMAGAAPTWGLKAHVLEALAAGTCPAAIEVQSRLAKLFPECRIAHLPSAAIQGCSGGDDGEEGDGGDVGAEKAKREGPEPAAKRQKNSSTGEQIPVRAPAPAVVDCSAFLANAAEEGDAFRYHVDADPTSFPPGPWTATYGDYFNGEPGRPLLVTLLVYLDREWERDWGAETLFLDGASDAGVFVRPKPGRAVLMEQDVVHRVSAPSPAAGGRHRVSLVWKLAFLPKERGGEVRLARREWGPPAAIGSAAHVGAVMRQLAQERGGSAS